MKNYLFVLMLLCTLAACKKGDAGPAGIDGNANVTQYTFGAVNLSAGFVNLMVTTTKDTMDNSTWLVYVYYAALERWYSLPGQGVGGATVYRISMGYRSEEHTSELQSPI